MRRRVLLLVVSLLALLAGGLLFACTQTPTAVPVRTFERATRVDVLCLNLLGANGPEPAPQEACVPVPPTVDGSGLQYQLFALVTQSSRGEVAVVDLSGGFIVDQNLGVPGINFLPVGSLPTDIATTPDGRMAFVAAAEPNKFAIYGIPGRRVLGDYAFRLAPDPEGPPTLASWPVCSLPQRPGSLTVVPRPGKTPPAPSKTGDGIKLVTVDYELVAVLPGERGVSAKIVTIDPAPFLRGAGRDSDKEDFGDGVALGRGQLEPCPITSAIELASALPARVPRGGAWPDGVPYVDGGVDLACEQPEAPGSCGLRPCRCVPEGTACAATDAGAALPDLPLSFGPLEEPQLVAVARDYQTLYVADANTPLIHVVDMSASGAPREIDPLVPSSIVEPSRVVSVRDLAISPPTRDFKRFLYAVDRKQGTILVFDITDPRATNRSPLVRPHPELNPFQPPDRIALANPVVTVAFARHDFPIATINQIAQPSAVSGVVCNPNPNATIDPNKTDFSGITDFGALYRFGTRELGYTCNNDGLCIGPNRLRGVFGFATLTTGQVVAIDVDDWDAPCRRPADLATSPSLLAAPQPAPGPGDLDPFHAPIGVGTTSEVFFPVSSAPHRVRSSFYLRDDATTGRHVPFLPALPVGQQKSGAGLSVFGVGSEGTPRILPTRAESNEIGVRFSFETPDVHIDQEWTVIYEGTLPGFDGLSAELKSSDNYASLELIQPQARFCDKGVEDWEVGAERATRINAALTAAQRPLPAERLERRMTDYVQISDELLPSEDPYWSIPEDPGQCWIGVPPGRARFDACVQVFGSASEERPTRDFPILEAYDDRLVVGRFFTAEGSSSREIVYKDASNGSQLGFARCCFHHQAGFRIRAGSEWVTTGSVNGFLNHVVRGGNGRCGISCDGKDQLLNARAPALPQDSAPFAPDRDSPLAMRNPAFSFFMRNGTVAPTRDTKWTFQSRGGFQPLIIRLSTTTTSINPQSMRFIESLGQIAVVDAASQGLVLIDLGGVSVARAPYF